MNETTGQNEGFNPPEASNPVSPYLFYQMRDTMSPQPQETTPNRNGLNSPKHLSSLLSSPLFPSTPSGFRTTTNDENIEMGEENSNREQTKTKHRKKRNSKPAKPSIVDILKERKLLELQSESEAEDDRVSKKQKPNVEAEQNQKGGGFWPNDDGNGNETNKNWTAIWEESVSVTPVFLLEESENPYQESFDKLEQWTQELLEEQRKIETARIQNAIVMNKLLNAARAAREYMEND